MDKSVAIMQPYLFPYLGYFQLIQHVDHFVFFDTAQYIRRGWINRNRILLDGQPYTFTLPVVKAPRDTTIANMQIMDDPKSVNKLLQTIHRAYRDAPYFAEVYPLVEAVFLSTEHNLCRRIVNHFQQITSYLDFNTTMTLASEIETDTVENAENRILAMCETLDATTYINPWNGQHLYTAKKFLDRGIHLGFLEMQVEPYPQGDTDFVSHLSMLDVLMNCSVSEVHGLLSKYRILFVSELEQKNT